MGSAVVASCNLLCDNGDHDCLTISLFSDSLCRYGAGDLTDGNYVANIGRSGRKADCYEMKPKTEPQPAPSLNFECDMPWGRFSDDTFHFLKAS